MIDIAPDFYEIIIDYDELSKAFSGIVFPFNLRKELKKLDDRTKEIIRQEIANELKRDPQLRGKPLLTDPALKNSGVYKLRLKKENNKGKSSGYRAVTLLIAPFSQAYVLDIMDHAIKGQDDLTDYQKKFCNDLAKQIDDKFKNNQNT